MAEYIYGGGLVMTMEAGTILPVASQTGILLDEVGGSEHPTTDRVTGSPIAITTNSQGFFPDFVSDIPSGVIMFGSYAHSVWSDTLLFSAAGATASASSALTAAGEANQLAVDAKTAAEDATRAAQDATDAGVAATSTAAAAESKADSAVSKADAAAATANGIDGKATAAQAAADAAQSAAQTAQATADAALPATSYTAADVSAKVTRTTSGTGWTLTRTGKSVTLAASAAVSPITIPAGFKPAAPAQGLLSAASGLWVAVASGSSVTVQGPTTSGATYSGSLTWTTTEAMPA